MASPWAQGSQTIRRSRYQVRTRSAVATLKARETWEQALDLFLATPQFLRVDADVQRERYAWHARVETEGQPAFAEALPGVCNRCRSPKYSRQRTFLICSSR